MNTPLKLGVVGLLRGSCAGSAASDENVIIRAICDKNPRDPLSTAHPKTPFRIY